MLGITRLRAAAILIVSAIARAASAQSVSAAETAALPGAVSSRTLVWSYSYGAGGYAEFGPVKALDERYDAKGRVVSWSLAYINGTTEAPSESGLRVYDESGGYRETVKGADGTIRRKVEAVPREAGWSVVSRRSDGSLLYEVAPVAVAAGSFEYDVKGRSGAFAFRGLELFTAEGSPQALYRFSDDGSMAYVIEYRYAAKDERGNWKERLERERYVERWDRPKTKAVRTIVYAERSE